MDDKKIIKVYEEDLELLKNIANKYKWELEYFQNMSIKDFKYYKKTGRIKEFED